MEISEQEKNFACRLHSFIARITLPKALTPFVHIATDSMAVLYAHFFFASYLPFDSIKATAQNLLETNSLFDLLLRSELGGVWLELVGDCCNNVKSTYDHISSFCSWLLEVAIWHNTFYLCFVSSCATRVRPGEPTDHLLAVVLGGKGFQRWLNDTTSKSKHKVKSRLLLDVVIGESSAIFELLASEDQSLLIWWNAFLVLNLALNIVNSV